MALHRVAVYGVKIVTRTVGTDILDGVGIVKEETDEVEYLINEYLFDFPELLSAERVEMFMSRFHDNITRVEVERE